MSNISIHVSWGEAIDKLTILSIKAERIVDQNKLHAVQKEKAELEQALNVALAPEKQKEFEGFVADLMRVNQLLWDFEDNIRDHGKRKNFTEEFVDIARWIYETNDERSAIKARANDCFGSSFKEVKSYNTLGS